MKFQLENRFDEWKHFTQLSILQILFSINFSPLERMSSLSSRAYKIDKVAINLRLGTFFYPATNRAQP